MNSLMSMRIIASLLSKTPFSDSLASGRWPRKRRFWERIGRSRARCGFVLSCLVSPSASWPAGCHAGARAHVDVENALEALCANHRATLLVGAAVVATGPSRLLMRFQTLNRTKPPRRLAENRLWICCTFLEDERNGKVKP